MVDACDTGHTFTRRNYLLVMLFHWQFRAANEVADTNNTWYSHAGNGCTGKLESFPQRLIRCIVHRCFFRTRHWVSTNPRYGKWLRLWFRPAVACSLLLSLGAAVMLAYGPFASMLRLLSAPSTSQQPLVQQQRQQQRQQQPALTLAIPGLTIHWSYVGYMWVAIATAVVWHELGHSTAAAYFNIRTQSVGVFSFLCFPGAYVELEGDDTSDSTETGPYCHMRPYDRAVVSSAGVWHNVILVGITWLFVSGLIPMAAAWSFWRVGDGITDLDSLRVIDGINSQRITSIAQLQSEVDVLSSAAGGGPQQTVAGLHLARFCIDRAHVNPTLGSDCCNTSHPDSYKYQCFQVQPHSNTCYKLGDLRLCALSGTRGCDHPSLSCASPKLADPEAALFVLTYRDGGKRLHFAGQGQDLLAGLRLSNYRTKDGFEWLVSVRLLERVTLQWKFIGSVSASIALLNAAPIHYADGSHTFGYLFPTHAPALTRACSVLLLVNVVASLRDMLLWR